jgi:CRP-like cAMP-binding protein
VWLFVPISCCCPFSGTIKSRNSGNASDPQPLGSGTFAICQTAPLPNGRGSDQALGKYLIKLASQSICFITFFCFQEEECPQQLSTRCHSAHSIRNNRIEKIVYNFIDCAPISYLGGVVLQIIQNLLNDEEFKSQVRYAFVTLKTNEKILFEGEMHDNLYVIKKGRVRVLVRGVAGEKAKIHPGIAELGPNEVFGEISLFISDYPACADVVCTEDTELIEIDILSFRHFLDTHQEIGYKILDEFLKHFVKRMMDSNKKILHLLEWGIQAHHIDKDLEE